MITIGDLEKLIEKEVYWTTHDPAVFGPHGQITVCVLKTKSGFEAIGHSGTITPEKNFDLDLGKKYARENAINDLWAKHAYYVQMDRSMISSPFSSDNE